MEHLRAMWREAMALPDFKHDRRMSEKQVLSACQKILKDIAREFGYDGVLPDVQFDQYLETYARSLKPSREAPGGIILLSLDWFERARDPEQGYQEFRVFAHESIHALLQQQVESYANTTQAINEGGAEILSVAYWAMNGPGYGHGTNGNPDPDSVREPGRGWVGGDVALTSLINYPEWIVETMKRAASKVGWDPKRIVDEVARVNKMTRNAVLDWLKGTNTDIRFPGPETAEAMLLWMVRGLPVKRKASSSGFGVILEATYRPEDVNTDLTHTTKGWAATENEVNLKPGAQVTVTGVYLTDTYGWDKKRNLLGSSLRATAARGEFLRGVTGQVSPEVAKGVVAALNAGDRARAGRLVADWFASSQGGYNDSGGIGSWWGPASTRQQILYYAEGGNLYADNGTFAFPSYGKPRLGIMLHGTPDGDKEPGGYQFSGDVQVDSVEICFRPGGEFSSTYDWITCPVGKRYPMGR